MGRVADMGGDRTRVFKIKKGDTSSFKCDSCGAVRYVTRLELIRAARPRCIRCGGMLLETVAEEKRHKEGRKRVVSEIQSRKAKCRACGWRLDKVPYMSDILGLHLTQFPECLQYFREIRDALDETEKNALFRAEQSE